MAPKLHKGSAMMLVTVQGDCDAEMVVVVDVEWYFEGKRVGKCKCTSTLNINTAYMTS